MGKRWIQDALKGSKRGALHRQLGYPQSQRIPSYVLEDIRKTQLGKHTHGVKVTHLLKQRAVLALNLRNTRK